MQTVISNSTPIIHLAKIRKLDLLQRFFGTISLGETLEELESSGFRLHKKLKEKLLQEAEGN